MKWPDLKDHLFDFNIEYPEIFRKNILAAVMFLIKALVLIKDPPSFLDYSN